jgi:hypothetical protein
MARLPTQSHIPPPAKKSQRILQSGIGREWWKHGILETSAKRPRQCLEISDRHSIIILHAQILSDLLVNRWETSKNKGIATLQKEILERG